MTKLFCISDVHGFYDEMIKALNEAGFESDNPNHLLIGLGDYVDRGRQPMQVIRYLRNLPNKILIKGNHEDLFEECCQRGFPYNHDVSNGTYDTIKRINVSNNLDFEQKWNYYHIKPSANKWLKDVISSKPTFKTICEYLNDDHIYQDFESACAFVHGQDIASKTMPFIFYVSICYRFNMMMFYIFRTIRLFPLSEELETRIADLEDKLIVLLEKYYR